jgi:ribosomal protein S7
MNVIMQAAKKAVAERIFTAHSIHREKNGQRPAEAFHMVHMADG